MSTFLDRVASAPISWGICEVPGWGAMLPTPRVLTEMSGLGLPATELGAPGFLPTSPEDVKAELAAYDMTLIGGFTPVVLHDPAMREWSINEARRVAALFQRAGATEFISAIVFDLDWSVPRPLTADERKHMMEMFGIIDDICAEHGLHQVLHSHVQTVVETKDDIEMVLEGCDVGFCLDT
ncbi:MAG: sugar phosphate isomerase/epimerase family protein, partial [Candidatus Nanopelagicales bacterium]